MTRVTQLIHDAGKYLLISVYPLPTHPTHNFTHNNDGNLETLPGWPKKLQHNRPARSAGQWACIELRALIIVIIFFLVIFQDFLTSTNHITQLTSRWFLGMTSVLSSVKYRKKNEWSCKQENTWGYRKSYIHPFQLPYFVWHSLSDSRGDEDKVERHRMYLLLGTGPHNSGTKYNTNVQ